MKTIHLNSLYESDIDQIVLAFQNIGWNKPKNLFERYLLEQQRNQRAVFIAKENNNFCGYVTIKWKSDYAAFQKNNISEICDLNVLPDHRQQGIGSMLISACEDIAKERKFFCVGLGVGLTADYGNAQRLYVHLGYIPDGFGLFYKNEAIPYGNTITADDDLVIYLVKQL